MAKAKQRFSWTENPATGESTVLDSITNESRTFAFSDWGPKVQAAGKCFLVKTLLSTRTSGTAADDKLAEMDDYHALFQTDEWAKEKVSGGPTVGAHITLIMRSKDVSAAMAQQVWRAQSDEFKAAFMAANKEAIQAIKDEVSEEVDLGDMI